MEEANRPVDWKAEWIWHGDDPAPYHYFLLVRKSFRVAAPPERAVLRVTATDRYRLFLNGRLLGRGPERCDQRFQSYDEFDLTDGLRDGANCVAALAYFYGCLTGYTRDGRAGFLAQLELQPAKGEPVVIGTDSSWRVRPAKGWRRDAKMVGIGVGVTEVLDARLDPPDWMQADFDDSTWEPATVVSANTGQWCRQLEPRHIPFLAESDVAPQRVLAVGEILQLEDSAATADIPEVLARDPHLPLEHARLDWPEALLDPSSGGAVAAENPYKIGDDVIDGIRAPYVVLDMGRQVNGFITVTVEGPAGAMVDVIHGEQVWGGRVLPNFNSTRCADRYILREGEQTWESFEYRSFRYLQVVVRNTSRPVRLVRVGARLWRYPAPVRGKFSSGDAVLARLWDACVLTTDLCTDDAFMDSPFREKRNWLGDGSHAVLGALSVWGDTAVVGRYFALCRQGAMGDGMPRMFFPGSDFINEKTRIVDAIPQHALVWAARVWEYYWYFSDRAFLSAMYPTLGDLSGWCDRHLNARGLLESLPRWNWLDWTPLDLRGVNFGTNVFYLNMLDDLARIAGELGVEAESASWRDRAASVRTALRELFWDGKRGLYIDSIYRGKRTGVVSELGNGLAMLYGVADAGQAARIAPRLDGSPGELAPATPLFFHYVVQGLTHAGYHREAVAILRRRFAPVLERSTTLWEGWVRNAMMPQITETSPGIPETIPDGDFRKVQGSFRPGTSAATHCGALGAAFLLLTEVLGVKPRGQAFDGCVLRPRIDLLDEAGGVFPSPRGDIGISWRSKGGRTTVTVSLPPGVDGELHLPSGTMGQASYQGNRLDAGAAILLRGASHTIDVAHSARKE